MHSRNHPFAEVEPDHPRDVPLAPHCEDLELEAWLPGTGFPNGLHEPREGLSIKGWKARSSAAILITEVVRPRSPHQLPGRRPRVRAEGNSPTEVFARSVRQLVAHHSNPNDRRPTCRLHRVSDASPTAAFAYVPRASGSPVLAQAVRKRRAVLRRTYLVDRSVASTRHAMSPPPGSATQPRDRAVT